MVLGPKCVGEGNRQDRERGCYVYSGGSLLDGGNVGGGALVVERSGKEVEVECGVGDVATVWDGEVGMAEGLARVEQEEKVLILADSKAAAGREKRDLDTCRTWLTRLRSGGE